MRLRRPDPHTLAGAYAMDAVAGADRVRFERHLARCQACALELRGLREAAASLAAAVAADPPADLVQRAVAAARHTRQLPPAAGHVTGWRNRRERRTGGAIRAPVRGLGRRALLPRFSLAIAVILLAAAAASGLAALRADRQLGQAGLRDHMIAVVLNAPDAVIVTAGVNSGGTATVVMSRRDRSLLVTTAGLPPLPSGRCYQLWLMGPRGDRSAGMLPPPRAGMTSPVTASGLSPGDWVGLTVEPDGGTSHPTSRPVLMLNLAA